MLAEVSRQTSRKNLGFMNQLQHIIWITFTFTQMYGSMSLYHVQSSTFANSSMDQFRFLADTDSSTQSHFTQLYDDVNLQSYAFSCRLALDHITILQLSTVTLMSQLSPYVPLIEVAIYHGRHLTLRIHSSQYYYEFKYSLL